MNTTVNYALPSDYSAPKAGSLKDFMRRIRMYFIFRGYKKILLNIGALSRDSAKTIVEIGCGSGYLLSFIEKCFPRNKIIGLDFDNRMLDEAATRTKDCDLIHGNAENLPFHNVQLDMLFSLHNIEHLYHPEYFIAEAYRVIKPHGTMILATPNPDGIGARVMRENWKGWRDDHVSVKSPGQWNDLLCNTGFKAIHEHTTLLSGIPVFQRFPLNLLNWGLLAAFGSFTWLYGEAYISIWKRG